MEKGNYQEVGWGNNLKALCKISSGRGNLLKPVLDVSMVALTTSPTRGVVYGKLDLIRGGRVVNHGFMLETRVLRLQLA